MTSTADADQPTLLRLCIPVTAESWVARFEQACSLLERSPELPRLPISKAYIPARDCEELVEDRPAFFASTLRDSYRQVIISNGVTLRYSRTGVPLNSGKVLLRGTLRQPGQATCDLAVEFPAVDWSVRERLFVEVADTFQAHSGQLIPRRAEATFVDLYREVRWPAQAPGRPQLELSLQPLRELLQRLNVAIPTIESTALGGVRESELQPEQLGWLNHWSEATARWLGFPDANLDRELLERSYRTTAGAWLVKITNDPLDLTRADHVQTVAALYQRFPRLGIRLQR